MEYQAQLEAQEHVGSETEADCDTNLVLIAIVATSIIIILSYLNWKHWFRK
jgi:hypothetical protein